VVAYTQVNKSLAGVCRGVRIRNKTVRAHSIYVYNLFCYFIIHKLCLKNNYLILCNKMTILSYLKTGQ